MDYKQAKNKVNSLYREIFNVYLESLKDYVKANGEKRSMFSDTIMLDISELEILYKETVQSAIFIDELYYIPSKDELGFLVWDDDTHNSTYIQRKFKHSDTTSFMSELFYTLCN